MMKLNLGCGNDIKEGWINIDKHSPKLPMDNFLKCDFEMGLPFPSNHVDEVKANHILEHIVNYERLLKELYRVCKNNAIINIEVPHFSSKDAFVTEHVRFFRHDSFDPPAYSERTCEYLPYDFHVLEKRIIMYPRLKRFEHWVNRNAGFYEGWIIRNLIPADVIKFTLRVRKLWQKY